MNSKKLENTLKEIGFYRLYEARSELIEQLARMVKLAGSDSEQPKFEAFPSYIPAADYGKSNTCKLIIDIGGTSTKAGLCDSTDESSERWDVLFELKNYELQTEESDKDSIHSYASAIAQQVIKHMQAIGRNIKDIKCCAMVWSNAMINKPLSGARGVTGIVTQREYYNKDEWFIKDLVNGVDLGEIFLSAFIEHGLIIEKFLIANDTPLTMKSIPNANGGLVASTGLNGTLVKPLGEIDSNFNSAEQIICNAEMGGRFIVDPEYLSAGDSTSDASPANIVELLSAGRFLPEIFSEHIRILPELGHSALMPVKNHLDSLGENRWTYFRAKDMGLLLNEKREFLARRENPAIYTLEVLEELAVLSHEIYKRAAFLCTLVAYGTIINQIEPGKSLLIAVDSRLAREVPLFYKHFFSSFNDLAKEKSIALQAQLIQPVKVEQGKISVPMQGAANAIDSLLTSNVL